MKLIGVMSLAADHDEVRKLFEDHEVQIFSETDIRGHTTKTLQKYGWFASSSEVPLYSILCFAIVPEKQAGPFLDAIAQMRAASESDHPIRAFQVDVERMV